MTDPQTIEARIRDLLAQIADADWDGLDTTSLRRQLDTALLMQTIGEKYFADF